MQRSWDGERFGLLEGFYGISFERLGVVSCLRHIIWNCIQNVKGQVCIQLQPTLKWTVSQMQ